MTLGDGTRAVHAGLPAPRQGAPLMPGPTFASYYHLEGDPAGVDYVYGRYGNPTWTHYERALGELEGGPAVAFASGMAAASAVLLPLLRAGDALVAPADGYPAVRTLATGQLAECGVDVRLVPAAEEPGDDVMQGAKLVWLETPSNPGLETIDVAAVARRAHEAGALVAVDNTLATPLGQLPLELGADFSVSSDSKHLTGHGDLILGHVAAADPARAESLAAWRTQTGAIPGPFETWLAHRSLATLELRLERQCTTALALAERLLFRGDVADVRYPGLPADAGHAVARRQMRRFGTVVGFTLASRERAESFLAACRLVAQATSFGSVHSSAERRARWGGDDVAEGFIRLSVGCETPEDLIADVEQALDITGG
ncbi:MAG: cystathionine gamma-lyase [Thermoleophilaceae bacterium]|jgi:cystathionine gamma-lyase|nr:cystathionine gamma-lyase [Thermoleophilaceae bacterium]MEA2387944.1 cystathionine gamma-lyase [Thermoleophilaceae bacterium]